MLNLGLSSEDLKKFEMSLYTGYDLKIVAQVLDLNHRYLADVSTMLLDGQVNYSYTDPINYTASMILLDPDELIGFDSSSPSDGALYADRMIRLVYCVYSELLPRWVDVPIFCGPVSKVSRNDALLSVACKGKEALTSKPSVAWIAKTYKKGTKGAVAIKDIMTIHGETKFDIPNETYVFGMDHVLSTETAVWEFAQGMKGTTRQLFYDGRGVLRLRDIPSQPSWTFTEPTLLNVPNLDYNHDDIRNGAFVKGATPLGKKQLLASRFLPTADPSNPVALGRTNAPRRLMEIVEDSTLTSQAAVNSAADKLLELVGKTNVGFDFDSFTIPHLEPGDVFQLATRDVSIPIRLMAYSIPLKAGAQTNGAIKKISGIAAKMRNR